MTALEDVTPRPAQRIPFPVVDEVARHCRQDGEPETVHIEVRLPGPLDPTRLRKAFVEALHR
ncbi:condensation protein, partial [Streptomyces sp. NPDC086077]